MAKIIRNSVSELRGQSPRIKIWKSIEDGFNILVQNPAIFIPAFLIAVLNSFTNILFSNAPQTTEELSPEILAYVVSFMIWVLVLTLISIFLTGVIIRMVYDAKIKKSFFESARIAIFKYPLLLIASIIYLFIVGFGFFALIIPGIFLFVKFLYYQYAILLDNEGIINSLKKSWKITDGNWFSTFLIMLFFFAIFFISAILSLILGVFVDFITTLVVLPWLMSSLTFAYLQLTDREPVVSG